MISDSPYEAGELALGPATGIAAGIVGGLVMLAIVQVLSPISGIGAADVLGAIGPGLGGLVVHLATAGALGLLYGLSQQRIPPGGLVGVGVMFGLVVWIFGGLFAGWLIGADVREVLRSWSWLVACVGFGLTLAAAAVVAGRRVMRRAVVRD